MVRYGMMGAQAKRQTIFYHLVYGIPFLGSGFARSVVSDTMHGLMFALMPDDGLTLHKWPIVRILYMLPAREQ